jgi:hypothetical protein
MTFYGQVVKVEKGWVEGLGKQTTSVSVSSGILVYIYMWVILKLLSGW